ncbi:MAG: exopolysaccharide biosynthesis protein [Candidatus Hydrogenedens sp.]|nr:exopolysaccharide biosynthesis protein [Candidatus Hydrogenedens sp.]
MKLSDNIEAIFGHAEGGTVSVRELLDRVSHKSFGVLLAILALPSALPLPAPGYSVPFGILLVTLGLQMIRRLEHPWFPDKVLDRRMKTDGSQRLVAGMVKFLRFFEFFIRPRLSFVYTNGVMFRVLGCVVLACGISMCIPVPLTNTAPALGIFLIGLGMLEEDGLCGLAGIAVAIAGLVLAATVLVLLTWMGWEAIDFVKDHIKDFINMLVHLIKP